MNDCHKRRMAGALLAAGLIGSAIPPAAAAVRMEGRVEAGGGPVSGSTVTLWAASAGEPKQLAQVTTTQDGGFELEADESASGVSYYLIAKGGVAEAGKGGGDNPALAFLTALGGKPPAKVAINEMTTVASVWTHAQFLDGAAIRGPALSLGIAAGNVANFVDLGTGGWGPVIADALNSAQTPTMANFATLADVLAGCATRVKPNACDALFVATAGPDGKSPTDTLSAAESIVRSPARNANAIFTLLENFYPVPPNTPVLRAAPFKPYLKFAPSAWVLPLKFSGGGYSGGGKLMFDAEGEAWIVDNFMVGAQNHDDFWSGGLSKFTPNGVPLSPAVTGFTGGGLLGPGFGLALDARGYPWTTSFAGNNTISLFDPNGKPLSPPQGYDFGGKLGKMQGIIVTPSGDVWAADTTGGELAYFPKGDPDKGELRCRTNPETQTNPCQLKLPFALAVDQKSNIWITNILADTVTRLPGGDPAKAETFKTGYSGSGLAVDTLGNVWIDNKLGNSERGAATLAKMAFAGKVNYNGDPDSTARLTQVLVGAMSSQTPGWEGGSLTVLRPDGSEAPFSPIFGNGIYAPWAVSTDGNDNVWVSNFSNDAAGIVELCGFRVEACPPGLKTGDAISPPGGYVGGGLQLQVDIGIGPAGDVWVTNNWQDPASCYGKPNEVVSTVCAGQGVVVFYGMAKPVRTPQIGPSQALQ